MTISGDVFNATPVRVQAAVLISSRLDYVVFLLPSGGIILLFYETRVTLWKPILQSDWSIERTESN